jgi:tripartite-type tricarboxylate transporter receptor subunit TctC
MRRLAPQVVLLIAAAVATGAATGQSYPARTIRFLVPFSPGGASDTAARIIGQKLSERWGQQVVVENRPGAGGTIGTEVAARAQPDGYTLLMGSSTELAVNPNLYPKLAYNTIRDFAPVVLIASTPLLLVTHPSLPVKSAKELVALAKARPGELNYASSGNGATTHLAVEMFKRAAGVDLLHVPHTGSAPAVVSMISGQTQLGMHAVPAVLTQARAGRLRALAVTSAKRVSAARDLPTLVESGYSGMEVVIWNAIVAPAGTSRDIVTKIGTEVIDILNMPDVQKSFASQGAELTPGNAEQLAAYTRSELAKFSKVVKDSGARID